MFKPKTYEEQKKCIMNKKGRAVTFGYPDKTIGDRVGEIRHRTVIFSGDNEEDGVVNSNVGKKKLNF